MKLIDPNVKYYIGGESKRPVKYSSRTVGGFSSLPPWSKAGMTYGDWIKSHPVGNNPIKAKMQGSSPASLKHSISKMYRPKDMSKYIA